MHGYTLSDFQFVPNALVKQLRKSQYNEASGLFDCKLGTRYIDRRSPPESAVIKIQQNGVELLNNVKEKASEVLLPSNAPDVHEENLDFKERNASVEILMERSNRPRFSYQTKYRNSNFILGWVAAVEHLRSITKNVRTANRKTMTLPFGSIVFLKVNKRYWDRELISDAMNRARTGRVKSRIM